MIPLIVSQIYQHNDYNNIMNVSKIDLLFLSHVHDM